MSYDFNADDVLEMAEQLEKNGGKFYRAAAESRMTLTTKNFCWNWQPWKTSMN